MLKFKTVFALLSLAFLFVNCKSETTTIDPPPVKSSDHFGQLFNYDLNKPLHDISLSRDLKEISGLAYSSTSNRLLSINDEKGYVYLLDPLSAKIQGRIDFGKSNDYEGIAYNDGMIYVVESNGDIIVIDEETEKRVDKFKTKLSRKNDVEGLTYNVETSTFFVAAKGQGNIGQKSGKKKSIFSLEPKTKVVSDVPVFSIDLQQEIDAINASQQTDNTFLTKYQKSRVKKYSPSGIAVHPISNDIYILSSRGKLLTIFDQKGGLKGVHFLDEKLYAQPEGICFGPDLTMYISNEGRAGKGKICTFTYTK